MRIAKDYNGLEIIEGEIHEARYDEKPDQFIFRDPASEEDEIYGPKLIEVEERSIKVYPIGTWLWTWEECE